ncbi:hypothetical protein KP509_28G069200 [Ceratopteris richardii]|uniref:Secreted protein n=1 Tax=Ceratopteris richardii TaxID=49495 RepID=A0A8T2RD71_CERRI|nr:hypothetical protein KP509_28G069200 [Ceratopteris richardii]
MGSSLCALALYLSHGSSVWGCDSRANEGDTEERAVGHGTLLKQVTKSGKRQAFLQGEVGDLTRATYTIAAQSLMQLLL